MGNNIRKILVAEDSAIVQKVIKRILQSQDYQITGVKNGKEVLEAMKKDDYHVILMDLSMPVLGGIECTEKIRAMEDEKKSQVPIIAVTGNPNNYSFEDFKKAGINDYLEKPVNFDVLLKMIDKHTSSNEHKIY